MTMKGRRTRCCFALVQARQPLRHERRMDRLHRGRRLRHADAVARRWLGHRQARRLAAPALLGAGRRRLHPDEPARLAPGRPRRSCHPCQLLRGRRLRPLGRIPAADRVRVGGRGGERAGRGHARSATVHLRAMPASSKAGGPSADVRRCVGMDAKRLSPLSRLSGPPPGALGEYNGKFMCNQLVLARRLAARRRKAISARPTAISSIPISAGSSWACGLRETHDGRNRSVSRDPG